ncbi:SusC/RagA family TonB-linked outer membrane protein [Pseudoflavitalea sp. G-6-1-2]|uniref:SusC/RagA family TonB-linked outer membrane protein n=1 Tax=Pseudoflavitalea sp. G-6-1-2 TaxID=2728841 RepID=UPI00146DA612|nr:SusC/RagA family TonB-linked outer membrane protein [Pseudoflavitalea sp. G-6-1-2]NML21896.1 SusC/RagA family TonB-linked outer membrane protein [Pseudoflavitalea sp. G-6-1-2]
MNRKTIAAGRLCMRMLLSALFVMVCTVVLAQQKKISGTIINPADNKPLSNISVVVKGTSRGTTTDEKGNFSLSAAEGETLIISAVGYKNREIKVSKDNTISIQLLSSSNEMESVVVTALGIKRDEKALGYSVTKLGTEELTDAMSNNWTNSLQGKVAGLSLLKSGGGPAGTNRISLRGDKTLTGYNDALIVVDGVVTNGASGTMTGTGSSSYLQNESPVDFGTSLNDINPEDIESVTFLKGPGAAALYGARGSNGAVIITTKSGKSNTRGMGVTINSNLSFDQINRWPDYQYEYGQGAAGQNTWYSYNDSEDGPSTRSTSSSWGPKFNGQKYYQYDPVTRTKGETRTEWVPYKSARNDFFETGNTFTNTITLEGGSKNTSARLAYTNLSNTWIIPNTGYKRNTVAASLNHKLTDKLQMAVKMNYTNKYSDNLPSTGYNNQTIMYFIRGLTPNMNINWFKDYWVPGKEQEEQTRPFSSLLDNPYLQAYEMLNKSNRNNVIGNVSATYSFNKDLSLMVRSSLDYSSEQRAQQRPKGSQKFVDGMFRTQHIFSQEMNHDFMLRYAKKVTSKFNLVATLGGSNMSNRYQKDELRADKLLYPGVYSFANSKVQVQPYPYRAEFKVNSIYALAQFEWDGWIFLDMTSRHDWASTLATPTSLENTGFFYPSVNLSTVLSERFKMPSIISYLKLRASVAEVGGGAYSPYQTAYNYSATGYPGGLTNPSSIPKDGLKPFKVRSFEAGMDLRFAKNRYGLDFTFYNNHTMDDIINVPIDRASGYYSLVTNASELRNIGIEISANANVIKTAKGLNVTLLGTFSTNRNRIIGLADGVDTYVLSTGPANRGSQEARPGGRIGDLYGLGYQRAPDGQIIYNDQGLPLKTETVKYLGNVNPDWKASFSSNLKWKNWGMSFLFDGQFGGMGYSLTHAVLAEEGKLTKTLPGRDNGIIGNGVVMTPDGKYVPNTKVVTNIQAYYDAHFNRDNVEANTFNTDFIKWREMRIDYTFSPSLVKKLGLQRATFGLYGRDLMVISNWPAFDPEFGTLNDGTVTAGFEIGQFPSTRSIGMSLLLGF